MASALENGRAEKLPATSSARRDFLKTAVAATVGAVAVSSSATGSSIPAGPAVDVSRMPRIRLGRQEVSRLILGANPQWGYSHRGQLLSDLMTEWYTPDRVVEVLHHSERCGINTWQSSVSGHFLQDWQRYREEGGKMNLILLVHPTKEDWAQVRRQILPLEPLALVHHGGDTDRFWRQGKMETVRTELKRFRDDGVLVGCSSHLPDVIRHIAEEDWDVDLFMTCLYQISLSAGDWKEKYGFTPKHEMYTEEMPGQMLEVIRQVPKPCLAFKILAAGRAADSKQGVEAAFRHVLRNIKALDGVIVGMFPRLRDEVAENANWAIQYGQASSLS